MKYKIKENNANLDIDVDVTNENKDELIQAFQECQEGRCSCPTKEYEKLESLVINQNDNSIQLQLKSKDGTKMDKDEINRCLEHTAKHISNKKNN